MSVVWRFVRGCALILCAVMTMGLMACGDEAQYGVFLGVNEVGAEMTGYDLVVLDADAVDAKEISKIKGEVYSYLNVGTVETYRDYYDMFDGMGLLLDVYEDWPDERFVDVSDERWQDYVVDVIAKRLAETGVDGFFLDNFDVYYNYGRQAAYLDGLIAILRGLKDTYGLQLMINGGDVAVKEIIKTEPELIDAVNQECVFTNIDFENDALIMQDAETRRYYQNYLKTCKGKGIDVYLLEYGDGVARSVIDEFCERNGYKYYISKDLDLTEAL